jgi:hypothetical protein
MRASHILNIKHNYGSPVHSVYPVDFTQGNTSSKTLLLLDADSNLRVFVLCVSDRHLWFNDAYYCDTLGGFTCTMQSAYVVVLTLPPT